MGKIEKEKSLAFLNPELAREWHPTKNGELTPYDVTANSDKKVWWSMPYDDSDTGKHYDFEWEASISNRMQGNGCPFLKGKAVWPGYNDLATRNPELAREWHPIKNGELMPQNITMNSGKKVWWFLCYTDPETGKYFEFEWETPVFKRNKGEGCPYLSGVKVWKGYNDLATLRPDLAAEWDYDSNSELTPDMVTVRSNKNIGWICAKGHRWEATVDKRSSGQGCPFCSGKRVIKGETDLATVNPQLAKEWDHDVNGNLTPFDVTVHSGKKVGWICPEGHRWMAKINNRSRGKGCPYCEGKKAIKGENDLATVNPQLAAEWDYDANGDLLPEMVTVYSNKRVGWICSKGHRWKAEVANRTEGTGCPYCAKKRVIKGETDLATCRPELIEEWDYVGNGNLMPDMVSVTNNRKVWWICSICGNKWIASPHNRNKGHGNCPKCKNRII